MKMYKVSSLGSDIIFSEGGVSQADVSVSLDAREGIDYAFTSFSEIPHHDLLRAISAYLLYAKGLPSSVYTVTVDGTVTPIPVPREGDPSVGGRVGVGAVVGGGVTVDGVSFTDVVIASSLVRITVFDSAPAVEFGALGKALLREGGDGVTASAGVFPTEKGYSISVTSGGEPGSHSTVIAAAAYLLHCICGAERMRLTDGENTAECTVKGGDVSVFDPSAVVTSLLSRPKHDGSV